MVHPGRWEVNAWRSPPRTRWRQIFIGEETGETARMLQLRPNCEWCDVDLPPDSPNARVCSFECTWCADCIDGPGSPLADVCPNCGGNVVPRPIRPAGLLESAPPSTERVHNANAPGRS